MQRLGSSPRALCHRTATRQPFHQTVRHVGRKPWPRMKSADKWPEAPIFDVGPLLLDLDAENAKNIRQYDPEIDGEPEGRYAKRDREEAAVKARILTFLEKSNIEANKFKETINNRYYEWHINDLDVLSAVLSSPAQKLQSVAHVDNETLAIAREVMLAKARGTPNINILERNGIPQGATRNSSKLLSYMIHRQEQARAQARSNSGARWESSIRDLIRSQKSFGELKRTVQFLLGTSDGSTLVSKLSGEIGKMCFRLASASRDGAAHGASSTLDMLAFSNDIVINLSERRLQVEPALWHFGFQLAVRCSEISAARMYLTAGLGPGSQSTSASEHLIGPLRTLLNSLEYQELPSTGPEHHAAILNFVTGPDFIGQDAISSVNSMMQFAQPSDSAAFAIYIQILGELGALRTLWHIYQQMLSPTSRKNARGGVFGDAAISSRGLSSRIEANSAAKISGQESLQFFFAFSRFIKKVLRDKHLINSFQHREATGTFGEDCSLDVQTIRRSHRDIRQDHQYENQEAAEENAKERNRRESLPPIHDPTNWQSSISTANINENWPGSSSDPRVLEAFANPDIKEALIALYNILVEKTANTKKPMETPSN